MTEHPEIRLGTLLRETLDRVQTEFGRTDSEAAAAFARHLFANAHPEDIEGETPDNLFGLAGSAWNAIRDLPAGGCLVRAYNPDIERDGWHSQHTVVEAFNPDSPFLLDSTLAALNQLDLTIHLVLHPVVPLGCDPDGRIAQLLPAAEEAGREQRASFLHVQVTQAAEPEVLARIESTLRRVYADVKVAVQDWLPMRDRLAALIGDLRTAPPPGICPADVDEGIAFLEWLAEDNFTFLGTRDYSLTREGPDSFVRLDADSGLGILRDVTEESRQRHAQAIPPSYLEYLCQPELFMITKADTRSRVHRPVYMDYIGIRRFDADGGVVGERRFLGLLTSSAYRTRPTRIPLLRRKVDTALERSGLPDNGHDTKAMVNILETFPRDELFQIAPDDLLKTARGISRLEFAQRIRLFLRHDRYGGFFSALVYVPRDVYSTDLRFRMERILLERLGGHSLETSTQFSDAPMVRAHFIVRVDRQSEERPDVEDIERDLAHAARRWQDDLRDCLVERFGESEGADLHNRFAAAMPPGYRAAHAPRAAASDIGHVRALAPEAIAHHLHRRIGAPPEEFNFKVYHRGAGIPLSRVLPMLENMGLVVIEQHPWQIRLEDDGDSISIHDFRLSSRSGREVDLHALQERFSALFEGVWTGAFENDGYNALVTDGLDGREIALLRAYSLYLRQINAPYSHAYLRQTLSKHPDITRLLIRQFHALHDPGAAGNSNRRGHDVRRQTAAALDAVESADEDRILRRFLNLVDATVRTNFYQRTEDGKPKPCLALKFDSAAVTDLPAPRPWRETFVCSPRFEAVHLRGGRVARGGIRWSDRREDFRTEILGLVKAQMVKNAVIVPVGAKGGFVLKRPPANPAALRAEGEACYRLFVTALLEITDNLADGKVVPPEGLLRHDGDDPYLVVAADKGTATFSDIANEVAEGCGHWLGDAFASGGSAGYDHKGMGITARGAWEAIKRHFREIGTDIQKQPFTAVGIGDMSGDVFGNGMLLSETLRLTGAFNHLHIFVDPEPDAASSHAERARLFALPRSTWDDYDRSLISPGGGVFSRRAKTVPVSPQMRSRFGLAGEQIRPNDLIRALLAADVDLLWNGGIGTYVKSREETHAEVGDRANDSIRVNGGDLRCKVIGEGGNLGCTQAGRIEFARRGGRINTDAIDNSAGVDCSDHEVNIKILLNGVVAAGDMTRKQRDRQLADMTDEVARMVLRNNYVQTQCLTVVDSISQDMIGEQIRFMRALESRKLLDRAVEGLPDDEELTARRNAGETLTRPELSVLLAYAKMQLYGQLLESDLPDDPYLMQDLRAYFPKPIRTSHPEEIRSHRLRREIIATVTANDIVDRAGITFVHRHSEHTGISPEAVARAYIQVRDIFGLRHLSAAVEATDNRLCSARQAELHARVLFFANRATSWFLRNTPPETPMADVVCEFRPDVESLCDSLETVLDADSKGALAAATRQWTDAGVPESLAASVARLDALAAAPDIIQVARSTGQDVGSVAPVFFEAGRRFACAWIRAKAAALPRVEHWDMLAAETIAEDSYGHQRALTLRALALAEERADMTPIEAWEAAHGETLARFRVVLGELLGASSLNLSVLNVLNRSLRIMAESS